jgi:hypothetical protein
MNRTHSDHERRIAWLEQELARLAAIADTHHGGMYSTGSDGPRRTFRVIRGGQHTGPNVVAFDSRPVPASYTRLCKRYRRQTGLKWAVTVLMLIGLGAGMALRFDPSPTTQQTIMGHHRRRKAITHGDTPVPQSGVDRGVYAWQAIGLRMAPPVRCRVPYRCRTRPPGRGWPERGPWSSRSWWQHHGGVPAARGVPSLAAA